MSGGLGGRFSGLKGDLRVDVLPEGARSTAV